MNRFKNEFIELWLEDDILHAVFSDKQLSLDAAKSIIQTRNNLTGGKPCFLLADYSSGISAGKDVRDYFAGQEGSAGIKAGAIVVSNQFQKILINIFLTFSQPKAPSRIFSDRDSALKWIRELKYKSLN